MKVVKIDSSLEGKLTSGIRSLFGKDYERLNERFTPGEWFVLSGTKSYLGCANPFGKNGPILRVSGTINFDHHFRIEDHIEKSISRAYQKRAIFQYADQGCRLFFGEEDGLSGLVIDVYLETIIISISSFGIWSQSQHIKKILDQLYPDKKKYTSTTKGVNAIEEIPEGDEFDFDCLKVVDNGLLYELETQILQKGGYYYDHKNNRQKMEAFLKKLKVHPQKGLDLFSYVGSWGMHLIRSGCQEVEFVDQANMNSVIERNLLVNGFGGRGIFTRGDVYKVLDEKIKEEEEYDIIVSDPPAFTKSEKAKENALRGYEKLHLKCLSILKDGGVYVAASCTSHVSLNEFDDTVQSSAKKIGKRLVLADVGVQGEDHMMSGLKSRSNYIKYLLYLVWE